MYCVVRVHKGGIDLGPYRPLKQLDTPIGFGAPTFKGRLALLFDQFPPRSAGLPLLLNHLSFLRLQSYVTHAIYSVYRVAPKLTPH